MTGKECPSAFAKPVLRTDDFMVQVSVGDVRFSCLGLAIASLLRRQRLIIAIVGVLWALLLPVLPLTLNKPETL